MRRRGESNFRIKIFEIIEHGEKGEFGELLPELALLTARNNLEYLYTKIRFSTPAHVGLRVFCAHCKKCRANLGSKGSNW